MVVERLLSFPRTSCLMVVVTMTLLTSVAMGAEADDAAAIRANRMGRLMIDAAPGTLVHVEQTRHEFWFGAALASQAFAGHMPADDAARYREVFLENFNSAVPENALKWLDMEHRQGEVNYATIDAILAWTEAHAIPLRGHNIFWGSPQWIMDWQKPMDDATLHAVLEARGRDIGRRYRGRFFEYDLNNEMMHGDWYADRLGPEITLEMARWVREEDPDAKLFLNDYDVLTGVRLEQYVAHIRKLLAMGVPIAGIGVQGHLHGDTFDRGELRHALDELARFGLPIRITEFNLPGQHSKYYRQQELRHVELTPEEEEAKAHDLVDYYRICFAHPAVTGILMWGFWEGANWIPQSSLYKRDWSPTPAALAYRDLVFHQWWTHADVQADANGHAEIPAFFGNYRVSSGDKTVDVTLPKARGTVTVNLH